MLNKGFILENRYKIDSVVGKGGTSIVYRALDMKANDAQRAVKEVMKTNGTDAYNARQESLLIKQFYEKDTVRIAGVAKGREEAEELVREMVEEMYADTGGFDSGNYFFL